MTREAASALMLRPCACAFAGGREAWATKRNCGATLPTFKLEISVRAEQRDCKTPARTIFHTLSVLSPTSATPHNRLLLPDFYSQPVYPVRHSLYGA